MLTNWHSDILNPDHILNNFHFDDYAQNLFLEFDGPSYFPDVLTVSGAPPLFWTSYMGEYRKSVCFQVNNKPFYQQVSLLL